MKEAIISLHIPTKERPTQKFVLIDKKTNEIISYAHNLEKMIEWGESEGYTITNKKLYAVIKKKELSM